NVTVTPDVSATRAGIATLDDEGYIDLIVPKDTIDADGAGIRSSRGVNIAALHVVNADNIQAQGDVTGVLPVATFNVGVVTSGSSDSRDAGDLMRQERAIVPQNQDSVRSG